MLASSIYTTTLRTFYLILAICNPAVAIQFHKEATDCYFQHRLIDSAPYLNFTVQPGRTCWEYCKYLNDCTALSFDLETSGVCSLYNDLYITYLPVSQNMSDTIYSG